MLTVMKKFYEDVDKANCLNDFVTSVSTVDDSNINIHPFQLSMLSIVYLLRQLLVYIRYFPYNYTVMYMCKK